MTTQLPEFLGGPTLGPVCPSPLFGRAGILAPDTPAELAANGHGQHGESPGLGRGTLDYGLHSALTCCVIHSPLLFLSGLQFPHLRNGLVLGGWELKDEAYWIGFVSSCSLRLHPGHMCCSVQLVCVRGGMGGEGCSRAHRTDLPACSSLSVSTLCPWCPGKQCE